MAPKHDPAALMERALEQRRRLLGPNATLLDAARDWHEATSLRFETRWRGSKNPIWVWRALTRLASLCVYAGNLCPELRGKRFVGEFPSWCVEYLIESAYRIEQLAAGYDFRISDFQERFGTALGPLTPDDSATLLPAALLFTRRGWSAFKEYKTDDFLRLYLEVEEIAPGAFPFEDLMATMGWVDERSARRRLADIRKSET